MRDRVAREGLGQGLDRRLNYFVGWAVSQKRADTRYVGFQACPGNIDYYLVLTSYY